MTVLFTEHALDRLQATELQPAERQELGHLLTAVDAAAGFSDLTAIFPGTVAVIKRKQGEMLMVPHGRFRAVVIIEPTHPDHMVVTGLYRDDEDELKTDVLREAIVGA